MGRGGWWQLGGGVIHKPAPSCGVRRLRVDEFLVEKPIRPTCSGNFEHSHHVVVV